MERDPFINYKLTLNDVEREFITEEEIQTILDKQFASNRLEI